MPKQSIRIDRFLGMFGSVDPKDLRPGMMVYAQNLNHMENDGKFVGLPQDEDTTHNVTGGELFFPFADGALAAYNTGSAISCVNGLGGTLGTESLSDQFSSSEALASGFVGCGVSDGEAVHMGLGIDGATSTKTPCWVGKPKYGQFGGSAPTGYGKYYARLTTDAMNEQEASNVTATYTATESDVAFEDKTTVVYYASLTYDGFQEGPLIQIGSVTIAATGSNLGASSIDVRVRVRTGGGTGDTERLNGRVTGVNLYRTITEFDSSGQGAGLTSDYYLVASLDIVSGLGSWTSTSWTAGADTGYYYDYTDDGFVGGDYARRTGMSPVVTDWDIHYAVSCNADGYHVVSNIWHNELGWQKNMLLRSKYYRFDTFNWAEDYLVLPTEIIALAHFAGRTYAFSDGHTYIINIQTLTIEETLEGIGILGQKAVTVTDAGMFWCDARNIYWHDGSRINNIGTPILNNDYTSDASWLGSTVSATNVPVVFYHPRFRMVWFLTRNTGSSVARGFGFHIDTGTWQLLSPLVQSLITSIAGAVLGPDGTAYYVTNSNVYSACTSTTTRKTWIIATRDLVEYVSAPLIPYHAIVEWNDTDITPAAPLIDFYKDTDLWATSRSASAVETLVTNKVTRFKINLASSAPWDSYRKFALDAIAFNDTTEMFSMDIIYRVKGPR